MEQQFYSLTLTLSPRARENRLDGTASLQNTPRFVGDGVLAKHAEATRRRRPGLNKMRYQFYSLTLTLSQRARENRLDGTASLRSLPNIL